MKKIFMLLIMILFLVGCNLNNNETKIDNTLTGIDKKIEDKLSNMTLDEKIGQMLIIFYRSPNFDNTLKDSLNTVKPGGFILFSENITTYADTLEFIKKVKSTSDIPMLISIDQEGGNVQRLLALKDMEVSNIPYMNYVGATEDALYSKEVGKVIAEELRVFGINMDFAPVIDVYSNPNNTVIGKRSFSSDPEIVSKMGLSLAEGLNENGIIPVYKHFPGHGNTSVDSHVALPIVTKAKNELYQLDLIPFKDAIKSKNGLIMVGHLAVPAITKDNTPASLSKALITDFLKGEMGYDGLVITDALNMGALTKYYTQEEIYLRAIEAGVDLLLMPSSSKEALSTIKQAVENGRISEERIDESVRKILKLKYEKVNDNYDEYLPSSYLNSEEHQKVLSKIQG